MNRHQQRLETLRQNLDETTALLIPDEPDISYLTGFTGDSSIVIVCKSKVYFITDGRYTLQIDMEKKIELEVVESTAQLKVGRIVYDALSANRIATLKCARSDIRLSFYDSLLPVLERLAVKLEDFDGLKNLRMRKDEDEIEIIRQNLILTEAGYHTVLRNVAEGVTETEIAAELEYFLKKSGATKPSFDTIIASGARSALPHGAASEKKIAKNEVVLFDFGIRKNQYCSDFTRCYYFGKILDRKIAEIHQVVREAVAAAESKVRPGVMACEVHKAAFRVIEQAGYANYFNHSTGHGVGLEIHEAPRIAENAMTVLETGMVFTIEPGIYLPGIGGIRLEDMVVVRKDGAEVLTTSGYEL